MKFKYIKLIISLCLVLYLINMVDWNIVFDLEINFIFYAVVSVIIIVSFLFFMVLRWAILIDRFSEIKPKLSILYQYYLIGIFFNIFFPGAIGGDIARMQYSNKTYQLGIKKSAGIIFLERVSGLIGLSLIFGFSMFLNDSFFNQFFIEKKFFLVLIPFILMVSVMFQKVSARKGYSISYKTISLILVLSMLGQFADIFIAYILCHYFNLDLELSNFLTIMPLVYLMTVLPISIGGIGVREGVFASLLSLYNVNTSTAVFIAFLMYFMKILAGIIGWTVYIKKREL